MSERTAVFDASPNTTGDTILARRNEARAANNAALLARLEEIINSYTISGYHWWLRRWNGTNRPLFYFLRNLIRMIRNQPRLEATLRTPWWVGARRRQSYLDLAFLEEYGSVEHLVALVRAKTISATTLDHFRQCNKKHLREEARIRLGRAYAVTTEGKLVQDDADPVTDLPSAVQHPKHWGRLHVCTMIVEAADQGPGGKLGALYPGVLTDSLLTEMCGRNLVSDTFAKAVRQRGSRELTPVDTGELNKLLEGATQHTPVAVAG